MQLGTYLDENGLSLRQFAERVGFTHEAVRLWVNGRRIPRRQQMAAIQSATDGAVTPADFYPEAA